MASAVFARAEIPNGDLADVLIDIALMCRNLFRETVTGMFSGEERIPENVLKAMKLEDYGKGKPLTARRITAVKNAIGRRTSPGNSGMNSGTQSMFWAWRR